jgi:hypothetical protein
MPANVLQLAFTDTVVGFNPNHRTGSCGALTTLYGVGLSVENTNAHANGRRGPVRGFDGFLVFGFGSLRPLSERQPLRGLYKCETPPKPGGVIRVSNLGSAPSPAPSQPVADW